MERRGYPCVITEGIILGEEWSVWLEAYDWEWLRDFIADDWTKEHKLRYCPHLATKSSAFIFLRLILLRLATGWMIEVCRFNSRRGTRTFLLSTASRPALGSTGGYFPGVKWSGSESDRSPPPTADVKNTWRYTSTPIRLQSVVLN